MIAVWDDTSSPIRHFGTLQLRMRLRTILHLKAHDVLEITADEMSERLHQRLLRPSRDSSQQLRIGTPDGGPERRRAEFCGDKEELIELAESSRSWARRAGGPIRTPLTNDYAKFGKLRVKANLSALGVTAASLSSTWAGTWRSWLYRDLMAHDVDWPQAEATGEVFDLDWYNTGTAKAITATELEVIDRALQGPGPGRGSLRTEHTGVRAHRVSPSVLRPASAPSSSISHMRSSRPAMCGASST